MAAFVYYKSGEAPTPAFLERIDFAHRADGPGMPGRGCSCGPDGKSGFCFTLSDPLHPNGRAPTCGYFPDRQTWIELVPDEGLMAGWETDNSPGPFDLQRSEEVNGVPVEFGDGNEWLIPVLRTIDGECGLPACIDWDENWKMRSRVCDDFVGLWNTLQAIAGGNKVSEPETITLLDYTLRQNYRMTACEASAVGLLTAESMVDILLATVGLAELKAKASVG